MNRPPSSRPDNTKPPRATSPGLTQQQVIILVLVFVLGSAVLALAGWALFSPGAVPNAAVGDAVPTASPQPAFGSTPGGPQPTNTAGAAAGLPPMPDACLQPQKGFQQGALLQVIDGSTLEIQVGSQGQRISYAGIEVSQNSLLAQAAAQTAGSLLTGQPVFLISAAAQNAAAQDAAEQDARDRLPRYLVANGKFVNLELVRQGLAKVDSASPDQACATALQQAQAQAQADHLGIWKPTPVPTRTFMPFVTLDSSSQAPCECSARPTCQDFSTHAEAQACFNACNDYNSKLDDNHDGIACPELP